MHCKKTVASDGSQDVACYVTNYGNILTPDAQDVVAAVGAVNPIATVAMEWSRIESSPGNLVEFDDPQRVVKFFVYVKDGATTKLPLAADLNSGLDLRARPIPQLCMVCHGGQFPTAPSAAGVPVFNNRNDVKLRGALCRSTCTTTRSPPPRSTRRASRARSSNLTKTSSRRPSRAPRRMS